MKTYTPGTLIANRYEVASRPLMGGMGIVYICLDCVEDRPVALKTFKPEYLPDRAARDRFLREGTAWVQLGRHPHVVRCYQVERTDDGLEVYLILELIAKAQGYPDASLRSWLIPGQPLPVEAALLFALQIARGMQYATDTIPGFVHRDLKPENVLVGADRLSGWSVNRLRITDFGLAGVLQSLSVVSSPATGNQQPVSSNEHPVTRTQLTHGIVGTPLYMAPEQWRGESVGVHTDIYALGCILQELVTGQCAAAGNSLAALQQAHCVGDLRPLSKELPEVVRALLVRCLTLEPARRYADWAALSGALALALERLTGQPVPAPASVSVLNREERLATGWSYSAMGAGYLDLGKAAVAVGYFERAATAGRLEGEQRLEGVALGNLGLAYADLGDARRAIGYYEQSLAIDRASSNRRGEGTALNNLGLAYADLGDTQRAINYHEQSLAIARETDNRSAEGQSLGNLGIAYNDLGDARRAIGYHEQSLAIAREIGERRGETASLNNMGEAYRNLGAVRRAIGYYEQTLIITREIGDRRREGVALGNLGSAYLQLGDARRAVSYYEQYLEIAREVSDRRNEGKALGNLGSAYLQLGDAWRAIGYYEQRLEIAYEIDDINGVASVLFNMAFLYAQQGEAARALPLAQEAARSFAQTGHVQGARRAQQLLVQLQGGG